ncbi:Gef1p [Sugiyamaella lignohabitans]|uniref:Chloride channel protein n=1 Tax=Sugiyamaella lignohabitans TaxID=796027 RepID=A0A167BWV0_9ASCO|nr:Gef1p [Sugiyamaella lignohabitans]ANB10926.1 Gef1p [Sugiyamaella lignohabitans]
MSSDSRVHLESLPSGTSVANDSIPDSLVTEIRRYEDFSTIDWVEAASRENTLRIRTYKNAYGKSINSRRPSGPIDPVSENAEDSNAFGFDVLKGTGARYGLLVRQMYSAAQSWLVLALVGACIGLIAGFLSIVTELLSDFKTGYCTAGLYLNENFCCSGYDESDICPEWHRWSSFSGINYVIYIVFSTFFAFLAAFFVYSFAPYAAGSGISEIKCIIAGFIMNGFLDAKTLFIKSVTLPLTIASGLSVGKEGPSVHYAVCVGNTVAGLFPKYRVYKTKMREVLSSCAAAGVAVAFGSPMGGVLFSLEEMTSSFQLKSMWRSYFCALVATATLASVNPFRTGQLVLFSVKYDHDWHFFEIIFFILIGLFGGFGGLFIIKWNLRVQAFRKKYLGNYAIQEATLLAFITAVICYFNEFLRIDMTESMQILFHECDHGFEDNVTCQPSHRMYLATTLIFGMVIRTILTIISYGSKVPAGIFVPSLAIGALFGRFVGTVVWWLHDTFPDATFFSSCPPDAPCITPGTYALLGSAALLSGVMNITVTVVVIIFEVTGALRYILPTMIVVGVTKAVGDYFGPGGGGIADRTIVANGYPFLEDDGDDEHNHYANDPIELAMTKDPIQIPSKKFTISHIQSLLDGSSHQSYPVVDIDDEDASITSSIPTKSSTTATTINQTTNYTNNYLIGYIWRSELEYIVAHNRDTPDRYVSFDSLESSEDSLNFSRLVNFSPVVVQNNTPLSKVIALFSKVGPRIVYVERNKSGTLCGLLTRKDILKYQHKSDYAMAPPDRSAAEEMDRKIWELLSQAISKVQELVRR